MEANQQLRLTEGVRQERFTRRRRITGEEIIAAMERIARERGLVERWAIDSYQVGMLAAELSIALGVMTDEGRRVLDLLANGYLVPLFEADTTPTKELPA